MDYKEKFEGFLDKMQGLLDNAKKQGHIVVRVEDLENAFPELCEPDDEKIRKWLITQLELKSDVNNPHDLELMILKSIAWLENQGQEPTKVSIWKHWKDGICGNGEGKLIYLIKNGVDYSLSSSLGYECDYILLSDLDNLMLENQGKSYTKRDVDNAYVEGMAFAKNELEKQGEQKPILNVPPREVILSIWDLGNEWKELTNGCISTEYGTQLDYIQKHWHESEYYLREKQGEQKLPIEKLPEEMKTIGESLGFTTQEECDEYNQMVSDLIMSDNKVKPKFHEGEWVVFNDKHESVYQIEKIENFQYILRHILGGSMPLSFSGEDMIRPWAIQDARDGDVLSNGKMIVIFKHFEEPSYRQHIVAYIGLDIIGNIQITDDTWNLGIDKTKPATKEQRDLLFQKMKEAGYEWDAEKKELKKIELSDVGHEYYSELLKNDTSDNIADYAYQCVYCMSHDWAIENPTWDNVQSACRLGAKWQKKHDVSEDWSEEDEKMIGRVRGIIEAYAFSQSAVDVNGDLCEKKFIDVDIWLKSIKDRYAWKPSDEQMEALFVLLPTVSYGKNPAFSLYNDLKKLKGE